MNRASYAAFSATTIAALVLAACTPASTPAPATAETVRIYSSLPLTGSSAGQSASTGTRTPMSSCSADRPGSSGL